jgi:hypothetical protein
VRKGGRLFHAAVSNECGGDAWVLMVGDEQPRGRLAKACEARFVKSPSLSSIKKMDTANRQHQKTK